MKKIKMILLIAICALQAQGQKVRTDGLQAKDALKKWLIAWDKSDSVMMKKLSTAETTMKEISCLVKIHNNESPKNIWGDAKQWKIRKDTVEGVIGYSVIPTLKNGDNIPFFVQKNSKGQWVVNVHYSELCVHEEEENKGSEY
jgi:hypothetical protein